MNLRLSGQLIFYFYQLEKSGVVRYLSPESGKRTTMFLPLYSGLAATIVAALSAAPDEIPTRIPSESAKFLPSVNASSFSIAITSS